MKLIDTRRETLVATLVLAACGTTSTSPRAPDAGGDLPPGIPVTANRVEWRTLDQATTPVSLVSDRRRSVIRTRAAWRVFWDELYGAVAPRPAAPDVDFSSQIVVVATMGARSTGGYAIEVSDVFESDGTLFPVVVETSPAAGCVLTQSRTAPAVAAIVDRTGVEVSFVEEQRVEDCG